MKYLLWALVLAAVAMWLMRSKKGASEAPRTASTPDSDDTEKMVCCAYCGTYLPASDAIRAPNGAAFCNDDHRLRHVPGRRT